MIEVCDYEVEYADADILCACTCGGPRGPFDGSGSVASELA